MERLKFRVRKTNLFYPIYQLKKIKKEFYLKEETSLPILRLVSAVLTVETFGTSFV